MKQLGQSIKDSIMEAPERYLDAALPYGKSMMGPIAGVANVVGGAPIVQDIMGAAPGLIGAGEGVPPAVGEAKPPVAAEVPKPAEAAPAKPVAQPLGAAATGYPEAQALNADGSRSLIRQRVGLGERENAKAQDVLEPFHAQFNKMDVPQQRAVVDYMENRSTDAPPSIPADVKPAADIMRSIYKDTEFRLGSTKSTAEMNFIEDYYKHLWKDPEKADRVFKGFSKEGTALGSTRERKLPTIADGLNAGLEPVDDNPLTTTLKYADHMSRYNAMNEVYDIAKEQKAIKLFTPGKEPDGWVRLEGRREEKNAYGMAPFAPKEFAKDWNTFVSKGFEGTTGDIVRTTKAVMNNATAFKLALSGFHASTMTMEAIVGDVARAVDNLSYGRPVEAAKAAGRAMTGVGSVVGQVSKGMRGQQIYLGKAAGNPEERKIVDYLTQANMKPVKLDKAWRQTSEGNLYTAWRRGALANQVVGRYEKVKGASALMKPVEAAKGVINMTGRTLETLMSPIFEQYIPKLKTGAAMNTLGDWLKAHPYATHEETLAQARRIVDSIDNRFGEMNHDNIYMQQKMKDAAQMSLLSYSWTLGTLRELGGGAKDLAKFAVGSKEWTRRASYVIALPLATAYVNGVYHALKTGKAPQTRPDSPDILGKAGDFVAPQTGGTIPGNYYGGPQAERAELPGYQKEVLNLNDVMHDRKTVQEVAGNKLNPLLKLGWEVASNADWRGDPIRDKNAAIETQIWQQLGYTLQAFGVPISVSQWKKQQPGTGLTLGETFMGLHPAPATMQDPKGNAAMYRSMAQQKWIEKLKHDASAAEKQGDMATFNTLQEEIKNRSEERDRQDRTSRSEQGGTPGKPKKFRAYPYQGPTP